MNVMISAPIACYDIQLELCTIVIHHRRRHCHHHRLRANSRTIGVSRQQNGKLCCILIQQEWWRWSVWNNSGHVNWTLNL